MEVNYLDVELMEKMCHRLAVAVFNKKEEPIPPFSKHEENLLKSALDAPRASFSGVEQYPTLEEKAAVLYYHLNKNHPFKNGNKRIATASLLIFLYINDHWLMTSEDVLVEKALYVANSEPRERGEVLVNIKNWINSNTVKLEEARSLIE
jgi:death-on-curing family protein